MQVCPRRVLEDTQVEFGNNGKHMIENICLYAFVGNPYFIGRKEKMCIRDRKQLRRYNYDGHKFRRIQKYKHDLFHYKDSEYLLKYLRYKILLPHHVGNEATIVKQNSDDKANHSHALMHPFDLLPWEPQRAGLFLSLIHI